MLNRGELEGRFDAFYYKQEFIELEKKVKNVLTHKLRDLIRYIASGATPDKDNPDLYYSDIKTGVPFLRVQNVLAEGLDLSDVIFINQETHNKMLNRSKVFEDNLLITITGRIASCCVAPKDFDGNINQHSVVIKTDNLETSEVLATYLNSTVGQKLALRRTTGGTRPALDYIALKSIPIVFKPEIVEVIKKAYAEKKAKEAEAREKLASVDKLVLDALGITLPDAEVNTLARRIFFTKSSDIASGRFDAFFYTNYYKTIEKTISNSKVQFLPLKRVTSKITDGSHYSPQSSKDLAKKYVTVRDINSYGEINFKNCFSVSEEDFELLEKSGCRPDFGDVLFSKDGTIGKTHTVNDTNDFVILSSLAIIRPNTNLLNPKYLEYILKTELILSLIKRLMGGSALQRIILQNLKELQIPIPPPEIQKEIAERVEAIYAEAKLLREQGVSILKHAKTEVERMILGEG